MAVLAEWRESQAFLISLPTTSLPSRSDVGAMSEFPIIGEHDELDEATRAFLAQEQEDLAGLPRALVRFSPPCRRCAVRCPAHHLSEHVDLGWPRGIAQCVRLRRVAWDGRRGSLRLLGGLLRLAATLDAGAVC